MKEEPAKAGPTPSLLEALGSTVGSASKDDQVINPVVGSPATLPVTATVAEGARWQEKYSLLVRIFTARDRWSLEPHVWVGNLLKDFFQS